MGKINTRAKGHTFERKLMKVFIDLGWTNCKTSRNESRARDDQKVDLCHTSPFNIQAKAVEKLGSIHSILAVMPDEKDNFNLVWHKKNNQGSIVAMSEKDFLRILNLLIESGKINPC
jgi:hypothetical protein